MNGVSLLRFSATGLAARIILFLSLALVPIGVVAYFQTAKLQDETRLRSQLSLVALSEAAALGEREMILRAQGGAQAIGATLGQSNQDAAECSQQLNDYLRASPGYSYAGILKVDGTLRCNTSGGERPVIGNPRLERLLKNPGATAWLNENAPISRRSVIVVAQPFFVDGTLAGHVLLSVPSALMPGGQSEQKAEDLEDIITINERGEILSAHGGLDRARGLIPAELDLKSLIGARSQSFAARSLDGETRVFASAPLVPGMVHALGVWDPASAEAQAIAVSGLAKTLPFLMWVASVIVAFLAVNRLVIRHIKRLSRRMRAFARSREIPSQSDFNQLPDELAEMQDDFLDMADAILRDEAQQENALREKTILLKEVHHRVKNNLQLISSIMNMQIRQARQSETRVVLQRLQDRVRSLATIHRNLYQTNDLGHVDAGQLLRELVQQMTEMSRDGTGIEVHFDAIEAVPDQAVPLSLLTAEALTNALKYGGADAEGRVRVGVEFRQIKGPDAVLEVWNTMPINIVPAEPQDFEPTGLGSRLIRAFSTQVGGTLDQFEEDGLYRVRLKFRLKDFKPDESMPMQVPNVPDF